ncbi:MAG: NADP-dependent phosphogluconate dehydrogenase, partial [Halobacteriales archaeon]
YDVDADAREAAAVETAASPSELCEKLSPPRVVWLSVPHGDAVDASLDDLLPALSEGDVVVDAGNSDHRETRRRHAWLADEGVGLVDAGCSGGPSGALEGMSIMAGGDPDDVEAVESLLVDLAADGGYGYFGPSGAGHYVKMVHNGVEYAFMQALGEGLHLLADGEYSDVDVEQACRVWSNGSVVESRLVRLAARAFERDPEMEGVRGYVPDSGMGRWTVEEAVDSDVPATTLSHALFARYRSRESDEGSFADKVISALRREFGGHDVERLDGG